MADITVAALICTWLYLAVCPFSSISDPFWDTFFYLFKRLFSPENHIFFWKFQTFQTFFLQKSKCSPKSLNSNFFPQIQRLSKNKKKYRHQQQTLRHYHHDRHHHHFQYHLVGDSWWIYGASYKRRSLPPSWTHTPDVNNTINTIKIINIIITFIVIVVFMFIMVIRITRAMISTTL